MSKKTKPQLSKETYEITVNVKILIDKWYDVGKYEVSAEVYESLKGSNAVKKGQVSL